MFANARKVFGISGLDIKIDPSWLIIAALITWSLAQHYFPQTHPDRTPQAYLAMAIIAMLLFFGSLLLHELSHALVARRFGMTIEGITLFLFGGVAELKSEPRSAGAEFWIALAGPIMSLALSLGFWTCALIAGLDARFENAEAVLRYLGAINLILALFNLVPAFPLDGGRILRAYLWNRSGDILEATRTAARFGSIFGYALMALGLLALFQGALVSGLWQILLGGFVLAAARAAYQSQLTKSVFSTRTVADLMQTDPVTVSPDVTLAEFINQIVLRHGLSFVPVVEDGVLLGHIDQAMMTSIDRANWASTRVGDVFAGLDADASVAPETAVEDLLQRISQNGRRKFLVVQGNELVGVVSLSDLVRHLRLSDLAIANAESRREAQG